MRLMIASLLMLAVPVSATATSAPAKPVATKSKGKANAVPYILSAVAISALLILASSKGSDKPNPVSP